MDKKVYKWGVNYTNQSTLGRTPFLRLFDRLKDARNFSNGLYGYITRIGANKTTLHSVFGGFIPPPQEKIEMDHHG